MTPFFRGVGADGRQYQPMEQERLAFRKILDMLSESEISPSKLSEHFKIYY